MKKIALIATAAVLSMNLVFAEEATDKRATRDEAVAMVKAGVNFAKTNGKEKLYADLNSGESQFKKYDLYLVAYGLDGYVFAHGAFKKFIGKNLIDLKDVDGKEYIRERMDLAKTKNSFWQDFKVADPITKKVTPKSMYCEKYTDILICGGVYHITKK